MLGDKIEDILREKFFVSEDNYAWDMEELSMAIKAGGGVMRNPLSKHMFTASDIRLILAHPLGQQLRKLNTEQERMKKGVRAETINKIDKLGRTMLNFQQVDTSPLREQIDEFQGYLLTLSDAEQKTITTLKIPGRDSTSGQAFDYTIAESVGDAKANVTCFHKVGLPQ